MNLVGALLEKDPNPSWPLIDIICKRKQIWHWIGSDPNKELYAWVEMGTDASVKHLKMLVMLAERKVCGFL